MFRWLRDHGVIERNVILMGVLTLLTISIGGLVQIVPLFAVETTIERVQGMGPVPVPVRWSVDRLAAVGAGMGTGPIGCGCLARSPRTAT